MIETHARLQRPFIGYCAFWIHQLRLAHALAVQTNDAFAVSVEFRGQ